MPPLYLFLAKILSHRTNYKATPPSGGVRVGGHQRERKKCMSKKCVLTVLPSSDKENRSSVLKSLSNLNLRGREGRYCALFSRREEEEREK